MKFTASNGMQVRPHEKSYLGYAIYDERGVNTLANNYSHLNDGEMQALREFFQHERDEELGRWRWPENPDYVVYLDGDPSRRSVTIFKESTGGIVIGLGEQYAKSQNTPSPYQLAAIAYFEAHPERKPGDEAEDGEYWALTFRDGTTGLFKRCNGEWRAEGKKRRVLTSTRAVIAAERIWPKEDA